MLSAHYGAKKIILIQHSAVCSLLFVDKGPVMFVVHSRSPPLKSYAAENAQRQHLIRKTVDGVGMCAQRAWIALLASVTGNVMLITLAFLLTASLLLVVIVLGSIFVLVAVLTTVISAYVVSVVQKSVSLAMPAVALFRDNNGCTLYI